MFTNIIKFTSHNILFIINEEAHQRMRIWKAGRRTRIELEAEPEDEAGATWSGLQATGSLQ
jgi:hypothetical protein